MNKLSLDALKQRAEAIASEDLLLSISGGTENACHDGDTAAQPSSPAQPSTPKTSWEIGGGYKYDTKTGTSTIEATIKLKF